MTDDQIDGLVPIGPHDHPDPHTMIWSSLELSAIRAHTRAAVRAALEVQRQEVERLTIDLEDAKRGQAGTLNLVCRIRFAIGDNGARMQPELIEHLKQVRKKAEKYDAWQEAQRLVEEEMPAGYYVTLSMSPGDWSLAAYTDEGDEIRIDDYESAEQFIREAVEAAKAHHDRKDQTNA